MLVLATVIMKQQNEVEDITIDMNNKKFSVQYRVYSSVFTKTWGFRTAHHFYNPWLLNVQFLVISILYFLKQYHIFQ